MIVLFKKKCVCETMGKVIKVHFNDNGSRRLFVEYIVDGKKYILKENVTVKSYAIKENGIPIGQRKVENISAGIGESVFIKYNPQKPQKAYLRDNMGHYV